MSTGRTAIRPRRVRFDWSDTPLHWVPGDPQTTHTINVLHLLLPAGEKWFVEVYRKVLPDITDEQLRSDVKGFIGQEATHSRAHAVVLEHLAAQGIDTRRYTRLIDWAFTRLLTDRPLGILVPRFLQRAWLLHRLGIIAAVEHFTAVLGSWILAAEGLDRVDADPVMLDLLRWHGAEEVEHRSVAFDLFRARGGGYVQRLLGLAEVAPVLLLLWIRGTFFLMRADPTRPGLPRPRGFFRAGRAGLLPTTRELLGALPRFVRPSYHPSTEGSTGAALAYLGRSPAALAGAAAAAD
jgi:predicted metal-dependent hydrolase